MRVRAALNCRGLRSRLPGGQVDACCPARQLGDAAASESRLLLCTRPASAQLGTLNFDQIRSEVVGNRQQLAGCGIAEGSIQGFRAPFLNANPQVRQVLAGNQFLYDRCGEGGGGGRGRRLDGTLGARLCIPGQWPGFAGLLPVCGLGGRCVEGHWCCAAGAEAWQQGSRLRPGLR